MDLRQTKVLFLDCQTTGMRPPAGQLLELAWSYGSASQEGAVESKLISLGHGIELPGKIREITGIAPEDMKSAISLESAFSELQTLILQAGAPLTAVIHYAQFEKPFLADLFSRFTGKSELPFEIFCSHQATKRIFPNLPSQNIRGVSGFFGISPGQLKRAANHVAATQCIWQGLVNELEKIGIQNLDALKIWLDTAPKKKVTRYEYRLDRLKRIQLPDQPGVYRMIAKSGEVLYVGKATSLKSRVNSYFRGKKGRNRSKLEMLAQVWDLRVTECATPLEAALIESDEIKRLNPPYNVVLKRGTRHLVFYNHSFTKVNKKQCAQNPIGPFRGSNWIEHLRLVIQSLQQDEFEQIFFNPLPPENLRLGFELCCQTHGLKIAEIHGVRTLLASGMWILKNYVEPEPDDDEEEAVSDEPQEELELTVEEIAGKFERLMRRAAAEYRRAKTLTRMLNCQIQLHTDAGLRSLDFRGGILNGETRSSFPFAWSELTLDDFDRMSILLSELKKYVFEIHYQPLGGTQARVNFPRLIESPSL